MKKAALLLLVLLLAACSGGGEETAVSNNETVPSPGQGQGTGMGGGMGSGSGGSMRDRHHATIPEAYAGLINPMAADEASLNQGAEIYKNLCVSCHGESGLGDGPAAANIEPAPASIAHTSQMLGDDYLFWRVTEGGHDFQTAMPSWEQALEEDERWHVINYVRSLGQGDVSHGAGSGESATDAEAKAARHADMLAKGMEQGIITQAEADTFTAVHAEMDAWAAANREEMLGSMRQMQETILTDLVAAGAITQDAADTFSEIHARLEDAGLMQ